MGDGMIFEILCVCKKRNEGSEEEEGAKKDRQHREEEQKEKGKKNTYKTHKNCLLYTSDAAEE